MKNAFKFLAILVLIIVGAFLFISQVVITKPEKDEQPIEVIYKDWGTIKKISDKCQSSKHSLRCKVTTDKFVFNELDITDFPNDNLKEGDHIQLKTVIYKKSAMTYYVRNNSQTLRGSCFSWMPCFNQYEKYVN